MKLFSSVTRVCLCLVLLSPLTSSALLMRENGPEPVIIEIKEALRQSDALDANLAALAAFQSSASLTVQARWAGRKYLELVSFPATLTEAQANAIVVQLQQIPSVEKVVALSAYNLEFRAADFARAYAANETIPDVARRGFDVDRLSRPAAPTDVVAQVQPAHVPNQIIVRWKDEYVWKGEETGWLPSIAAFNSLAGCVVVDEIKWGPNKLIQVLQFDPATGNVPEKLLHYWASAWVDYVQPNYIYSANDATPSDPDWPLQWSLPRISAPRAWDVFLGGNTGIDAHKVAVGDTGATFTHPDLATNHAGGMSFIPGTVPTLYADGHGHGTHVASILGAQGSNDINIAGTTWNVGMLFAKVLDDSGGGTSDTVAKGIKWASANGAHAMNLSLGTDPVASIDTLEYEAVKEAQKAGMVIVAAAGNGYRNIPNSGVNSDEAGKLVNPASIPTDNMIAVGATDQADNRPAFSNYGAYRVELGAPGVSIYGLSRFFPTLAVGSGTSQAAPHVAGVLQLVRYKYPWEDYAGRRDRVLMGTDEVASLHPDSASGGFRTGGRLNAAKALAKRTMIRNLSTRGKVENGDRIVIGGFNVGPLNTANPQGVLRVIIRGIGPSLPPLNVPRLNNPKIRLNNSSGAPLAMNDDWTTLTAFEKNELAAHGLTPPSPNEAALIVNLVPGPYTVFVESQDGQFGVGSFEIYEIENNSDEQTRLINVSTRCPIGTQDEVAIAGMILGDPTQTNNPAIPRRRILALGKGPSIPVSGAVVPSNVSSVINNMLTGPVPAVAPPVLANPYLEFRDSAGTLLAANDQWRAIDGTSTGLEDKLTESGFAPTNGNESAVWPTLRAGAYTTILRDSTGGRGIGLVEFYEY